ncbi:GNAT family N-acetyltransferase [Winogradskyella sp. DF17]|uniref:GNAT family N-acetyltransferase n=1 Tax=Winogradskyella pelagia TaxID=2819984 RepID=A0ABS3T1I5_9FLAO|nr:GNAT family N-acetyltransferase [Winogradskyella sp. DF17]MBO3116603.1 GNAT family N-acetyltransferase [Winogradskyella sp. DF17]
MKTVIETERLVMRPVTIDDVNDFFELDSNPNVLKFLGNNPITSIEESKIMIKDIIEQYKTFGIGRLAITKKDTKEFIGWSGLKFERVVRKEFNYCDVGYRLKEQFWGNGYATEAALASIDFGFKKLKLKEICAAAEAKHGASNHILKKIGMTEAGTFIFDNTLCNWYVMKNPLK